jgi:transketolase
MDIETIVTAARECGAVVTAEEHQIHGGMGSAVAEVLAKNYPVPIEFVGVRDTFGGSGDPEELMDKFGLTWKEIYAAALVAMERRDKGSTGIRRVTDVPRHLPTDGYAG